MSKNSTYRKASIFLGPSGASIFHRFLAKGIDLIFVLVIYLVGCLFWTPFGLLAAALFSWFQDAMGEGQSLGKRMIGLRTIEEGTGLPCTFFASFMRNLPLGVVILASKIPVLGLFVLLGFLLFCTLEVYIIITLETGVRLGDVMANTSVIDHFEPSIEAPRLSS